jgi:hypothetical protein
VAQVQYSRQDVASMLRKAGFAEAADAALRILPDPVDTDQIRAFCQQYGVTMDDLISEMGGSP